VIRYFRPNDSDCSNDDDDDDDGGDDDDDDDDGDDDGDYIIVRIIAAVSKHYPHSTGHQDLTALLLLMRKTAYPNHKRLTENLLPSVNIHNYQRTSRPATRIVH